MSHWYRCITICMGVLQRGHPLRLADTVFAQGEKKQTLTNNHSCQRQERCCITLRYTTLLQTTPLLLRDDPSKSSPAFSDPTFFAPPILPVLDCYILYTYRFAHTGLVFLLFAWGFLCAGLTTHDTRLQSTGPKISHYQFIKKSYYISY